MTNVQGRHEPMGSIPNAQNKRKSAAISSINSETNTKTYRKKKKKKKKKEIMGLSGLADLHSLK
jgi:hypothetical protein